MRSFRTIALSGLFALASAVPGGVLANENYVAHLSARPQVPTNGVAVESRAQGQAIFRVAKDGQSIHYQLNVAGLEDGFMAHIHSAPAGDNGPVVVWLYPASPPPQPIDGRFDGVLAAGTITAANLVGPLAGQTLEALLELIRAGNAYVNVHTSAYPAGEVRGQIR